MADAFLGKQVRESENQRGTGWPVKATVFPGFQEKPNTKPNAKPNAKPNPRPKNLKQSTVNARENGPPSLEGNDYISYHATKMKPLNNSRIISQKSLGSIEQTPFRRRPRAVGLPLVEILKGFHLG